jgi:hypothetical protein
MKKNCARLKIGVIGNRRPYKKNGDTPDGNT